MDEKLTKWTKVLVLACAALVATACGADSERAQVEAQIERVEALIEAVADGACEVERGSDYADVFGMWQRQAREPLGEAEKWLAGGFYAQASDSAAAAWQAASRYESSVARLCGRERAQVEAQIERVEAMLEAVADGACEVERGSDYDADVFGMWQRQAREPLGEAEKWLAGGFYVQASDRAAAAWQAASRLCRRGWFDDLDLDEFIPDSIQPIWGDDCLDGPTYEAFSAAWDARGEAERLFEAGHVEAARTKAAEAVRLADVHAARRAAARTACGR